MLATHDAGNDTTYGLAATVWTRDIQKVRRLIESLTAGTVWIDCYNVLDDAAPFGGSTQGGFGREAAR